MYGGVSNNLGATTEEFFHNSLKADPMLGGVRFEFVKRNVTCSHNGLQDEFDLLLVKGPGAPASREGAQPPASVPGVLRPPAAARAGHLPHPRRSEEIGPRTRRDRAAAQGRRDRNLRGLRAGSWRGRRQDQDKRMPGYRPARKSLRCAPIFGQAPATNPQRWICLSLLSRKTNRGCLIE